MCDQLSAAAHEESVFPVLAAGCARFRYSLLRSKPDIGHNGAHALEWNIGAGDTDEPASLIVNRLRYADQVDLRAGGVKKRLADVSFAGTLGAAIPFPLGVVEVVVGGGRARPALAVDANHGVLFPPVLLLVCDVNAVSFFERCLIQHSGKIGHHAPGWLGALVL